MMRVLLTVLFAVAIGTAVVVLYGVADPLAADQTPAAVATWIASAAVLVVCVGVDRRVGRPTAACRRGATRVPADAVQPDAL